MLTKFTKYFRVGKRFCRALSSRVTIKDVESRGPCREDITILGWVKAVRKQKDLVFIDLNDGSSPKSLQIVAHSEQFPKANDLNLGCSLRVSGNINASSHPGQSIEMAAKEMKLLGDCDPQEYPFKARKRHGLDYVRQFPHLRARTNSFSSLLRIRHTATMAIHDFFQRENFIQVHTPILTSSDCEGAGDLFEVKPSSSDNSDQFFGCRAYLTVSGQLQAEALASGMHSVYTFGPTFRAEKSHTRRHLSEFYMVEAETVAMEAADMQELLNLIERMYKSTVETILRQCSADVKLFHEQIARPETKKEVEQSLSQPFKRLTYVEAVDMLSKEQERSQRFQFQPKWGEDLQTEHEQFIVNAFNQLPVFITDYPASTKAFYARDNDGDERGAVAAADLIVPGVGELVGGSLREERPKVLHDKLERLGLLEQYKWYMDLRRFGSTPHGGFGLGFERFLQSILGLDNIRDVIPFPRYLGSCQT